MKGYIKGDTIVLLAMDELKASDRLTVYESFAELRHDLGIFWSANNVGK